MLKKIKALILAMTADTREPPSRAWERGLSPCDARGGAPTGYAFFGTAL